MCCLSPLVWANDLAHAYLRWGHSILGAHFILLHWHLSGCPAEHELRFKEINRVGAACMIGISYGSEILVCYLYIFTYRFMGISWNLAENYWHQGVDYKTKIINLSHSFCLSFSWFEEKKNTIETFHVRLQYRLLKFLFFSLVKKKF